MKPLIDVLNGKEPERRPIWIMRQAGRYLPEYRAVRAKAGSFLGLCYDPIAAAEVTLQPIDRFDLDAAIVFSDILVVPHAMGLSLDFQEGEGPILSTVVNGDDVSRLADVTQSWQTARVCETLAKVKASLPPEKALIGFCGAPWTVASYMVEGRSSKREKALGLSVSRPQWFLDLIEKLVEASISFLDMQIRAGAEVVQIFDSWAGDIDVSGRDEFVKFPIKKIVEGIRSAHPNFPVIVFARGVGDYHGEIARATGASAMGVENGVRLLDVFESLPKGVAVQGNLSPELLLGESEAIEAGVKALVEDIPRRYHIFNLGHGILPQTNPDTLTSVIRAVRKFDQGS